MKTYWYYCLVAILFAASINTSAQAEEVSKKAADLMPKSPLLPTDKQSNSSNIVAQNNDSAANSINSQPPASNYWYLSGSVGGAFPNDIKSKNADLGLGLDSAFQWSVAGGYQWQNARAELEIS
jgi:opacity protein-like surface antigen